MQETKNPHESHRERVKARFYAEGMEHFADHQVLEMILFFAIPRKDTNETAHRLLERFGSLSAVFEASKEDLCRVEGIGAHAAFLIKSYPAVAKRYYSDRFSARSHKWSYEGIGRQLVVYFSGKNAEEVYAIFLDNALCICGEQSIHTGDINGAGFSMRKLAEACVAHKATYVILAHNHPHGVPIASPDDLDTTETLKYFLAQMSVYLIDHFIVAEGRFSSIDRDGFRRYAAQRDQDLKKMNRKNRTLSASFDQKDADS